MPHLQSELDLQAQCDDLIDRGDRMLSCRERSAAVDSALLRRVRVVLAALLPVVKGEVTAVEASGVSEFDVMEAADNMEVIALYCSRREAAIDELRSRLEAIIKTSARCSAQVDAVLREVAKNQLALDESRNGSDSVESQSPRASPLESSTRFSLEASGVTSALSSRAVGLLKNAVAVLKSVSTTHADYVVKRVDASTATVDVTTSSRFTSTAELERARLASMVSVEVQVNDQPFRAELVSRAALDLAAFRRLHWHRSVARLRLCQALSGGNRGREQNPAALSRVVILRYQQYSAVVKAQLDLVQKVVSVHCAHYKHRGEHYVAVADAWLSRKEELSRRREDALQVTNAFVFECMRFVQIRRVDKDFLGQATQRVHSSQQASGNDATAASTTSWLSADVSSSLRLTLRRWQESVKRLKKRKPHLFVATVDAPSGAAGAPAPRGASPGSGTDHDYHETGNDGQNHAAQNRGGFGHSRRYAHVAPRVFDGTSFERKTRNPRWSSAVPCPVQTKPSMLALHSPVPPHRPATTDESQLPPARDVPVVVDRGLDGGFSFATSRTTTVRGGGSSRIEATFALRDDPIAMSLSARPSHRAAAAQLPSVGRGRAAAKKDHDAGSARPHHQVIAGSHAVFEHVLPRTANLDFGLAPAE